MQELIRDDWNQDLQEIKQMNQVDLKQFVNHYEERQTVPQETSPFKQIVFSEERIL